jgi:hypothetical protein
VAIPCGNHDEGRIFIIYAISSAPCIMKFISFRVEALLKDEVKPTVWSRHVQAQLKTEFNLI